MLAAAELGVAPRLRAGDRGGTAVEAGQPGFVGPAVLVLLLCGFELGRYGAELWRRRWRTRDHDLAASLAAAIADPANVAAYAYRAPSGFAERAVFEIVEAVVCGRYAAVEHALASYELAVQRRLDRTRILVRAGRRSG